MFYDQKMKLWLFGMNCSYGLTISKVSTTYAYRESREVARNLHPILYPSQPDWTHFNADEPGGTFKPGSPHVSRT